MPAYDDHSFLEFTTIAGRMKFARRVRRINEREMLEMLEKFYNKQSGRLTIYHIESNEILARRYSEGYIRLLGATRKFILDGVFEGRDMGAYPFRNNTILSWGAFKING